MKEIVFQKKRQARRPAPTILLFLFIFFIPSLLFSQDLSTLQKIRNIPSLHKQLDQWVNAVVQKWEGKSVNLDSIALDPIFNKPLAVFVTAKKEGQVRGCMGSLLPREKSLADEIETNLQKAFSQDPRHRPIQKDELKDMEVFISSLGKKEQLSRPYQIDPARDAILIKSGSKEAVVLPGEAKTTRYLLAFLKAKAGIKKNENFQLYRLESESVGVKL